MKALIIKETAFSPAITLDPEHNRFEMRGSSRPENAVEFYTPVLNWLNELGPACITKNETTAFYFEFDYLNSISVKIVFDIFKILESLHSAKQSVSINWSYKKGDSDMKETGEEYQKLIKVPFIITPKVN